jgi:hypothetical protein
METIEKIEAITATTVVPSTGLKFKKALLAGYQLITKPGKFRLICQNNVTEKNLVANANGRKSYIATVKAVALDKFDALRAAFAESDEIEIDKTRGLFLTVNFWVNDETGEELPLPMKGEEFEAMVDWVSSRANKDTGEKTQLLRVVSARIRGAEKAMNIDVANFFMPTAEEKARIVAQAVGDSGAQISGEETLLSHK